MISRKSVLLSGLLMTTGNVLLRGATSSFAQTSAPVPDMFGLLKPEDDPEFGAIIKQTPAQGGSVVGTAPSRHDEVRTAFKLLLDAPRRANVIQTARYFEAIKEKNQDGEFYNREWTSRANPLITGLFAATGTAPASGDQTHWCAAFISFCLFLAEKPNKFTALSGGYRNFGSEAGSPTPGDIAVFAKPGPDGAKGFGHVGFFLHSDRKGGRDGLVLLGGNQTGGTRSTGAVTEAWFPVASSELELHSIRRIPGG